MHVLVAPQEFKGTLTAAQAAEAIVRGLRRSLPAAVLEAVPIADGGPGTLEALLTALGGERRIERVADPLGRPIDASWGLVAGDLAVVEMAQASGLTLLAPEERDPLRATTYGTGQLIAAALGAGCRRIWVGVGGSATNDGGMGAAQALGVRFLDAQGSPLATPAELHRLARVELSQRDRRLEDCELAVLVDVRNPLCGPEGASQVFGPQKGASPEDARRLDAALAHLAAVVRSQLGASLDAAPGAGAAGGLAYGLAVFAGARLQPGFEAIARALQIDERIARSDLVVTGEGRLDVQTAFAKGPFALAQRARAQGKPVVAFVGAVAEGAEEAVSAFEEVVPVTPPSIEPTELRARAAELLEERVARWAP